MSQPDQPFFECDETFVTFRWPTWAVAGTGESKITVSCELEHGNYEVSFLVEDHTDGDPKEVALFSLTIDSLERMVKIARVQEGKP